MFGQVLEMEFYEESGEVSEEAFNRLTPYPGTRDILKAVEGKLLGPNAVLVKGTPEYDRYWQEYNDIISERITLYYAEKLGICLDKS